MFKATFSLKLVYIKILIDKSDKNNRIEQLGLSVYFNEDLMSFLMLNLN